MQTPCKNTAITPNSKTYSKIITLCFSFILLVGINACTDPIIIDPNTNLCTDVPLLWENTEDAPIDYIIDCDLRISGDLVIEAGTVIAFAEEASLTILDGASIKAVGTASDPIQFIGQSGQKGFWDGIAIASNSVLNELEYVTIKHAGAGKVNVAFDKSSLLLSAGRSSLKNVNVTDGEGIGILIHRGYDLTDYSNTTVSNHDDHPVVIHVNDLHQLDGTGSTYTNNAKESILIFLTGGSVIQVTTDQTWKKANVPYEFTSGTMGINGALTIEAGAVFWCPEDFRINISSTGLVGSLTAIGTPNDMIRFIGKQQIKGYWTGIALGGSSITNELSYVEVADAGNRSFVGGGDELANIFVPNLQNFKINNCLIRNSLGCGMIVHKDSGATITNNTYEENTRGEVCEFP